MDLPKKNCWKYATGCVYGFWRTRFSFSFSIGPYDAITTANVFQEKSSSVLISILHIARSVLGFAHIASRPYSEEFITNSRRFPRQPCIAADPGPVLCATFCYCCYYYYFFSFRFSFDGFTRGQTNVIRTKTLWTAAKLKPHDVTCVFDGLQNARRKRPQQQTRSVERFSTGDGREQTKKPLNTINIVGFAITDGRVNGRVIWKSITTWNPRPTRASRGKSLWQTNVNRKNIVECSLFVRRLNAVEKWSKSIEKIESTDYRSLCFHFELEPVTSWGTLHFPALKNICSFYCKHWNEV